MLDFFTIFVNYNDPIDSFLETELSYIIGQETWLQRTFAPWLWRQEWADYISFIRELEAFLIFEDYANFVIIQTFKL